MMEHTITCHHLNAGCMVAYYCFMQLETGSSKACLDANQDMASTHRIRSSKRMVGMIGDARAGKSRRSLLEAA